MRAGDFKHFEKFVEKFNNESFIKELINSNWSDGASDIALFYEKNGRYGEAINVYNSMLEKYPDSEKLLERRKNAIQNR